MTTYFKYSENSSQTLIDLGYNFLLHTQNEHYSLEMANWIYNHLDRDKYEWLFIYHPECNNGDHIDLTREMFNTITGIPLGGLLDMDSIGHE